MNRTDFNTIIKLKKALILQATSTPEFYNAVDQWCNAKVLEGLTSGKLFSEVHENRVNILSDWIDHCSDFTQKQADTYMKTLAVEYAKAIALIVRKEQPLLAAAFDATK